MPRPPRPVISPRKNPRQARSTQLVDDILEAALRVLRRDGPRRFTTPRVAQAAGVSVGSLYQYFPGKEALLFRLQADEWLDTWSLIEELLADERVAPMDRLRQAVRTFFRSEQQEAAIRAALDAAGAEFRSTAEAQALLTRARGRLLAFVEEAVPGAPPAARAFAAEMVLTTMSAVAEKLTAREPARAEVDAWAEASAEMFVSYLRSLEQRDSGPRRAKRTRARGR